MHFDRKPEVLAPAGTLEAVSTAFEAGADAVYLGGKRFNMRQHRPSYNLSDDEIARAVTLAHERGRKLYVTVNQLMLEAEISEVREILTALGELKPDALIVQDLGAAALARELCVHLPLHASTMMNVHSAESASALKMIGFTRVITSRDIPLHQVRRMAERSGLEMEYFVHGDMCIAQSSQCYLSGQVFGESANRGLCNKPCRWQWELIDLSGRVELAGATQGFLLARNDMCLLQHIPELVGNGIVSLKIEGRMRTGEFVVRLVRAYREAVDAYFDDPVHYLTNAQAMGNFFSRRVRNYTTAHAFVNPGLKSVDPSGTREPRFFSLAEPEPDLTFNGRIDPSAATWADFELIAHVSGAASAHAALRAGADAIYLGGDGFIGRPTDPDADWLAEFVRRAKEHSARVGILGARIADERDLGEWQWWLNKLAAIGPLTIGVSNLGALAAARRMKRNDILADFSLNVCNSIAADELSTMGAKRMTASIELSFADLSELIERARIPVEVVGQGPLPGMLLEHCIIAASTGETPQGVCPMNCRRGEFALRDETGQDHRIECDRRCRNHVYLARDVCVLPNLGRIVAAGAAGLRIEAQFDSPGTVETIVGVYRHAIDLLRTGLDFDLALSVDKIRAAAGRPMGDGPFDFVAHKSIMKNEELKIRGEETRFVETRTNRP